MADDAIASRDDHLKELLRTLVASIGSVGVTKTDLVYDPSGVVHLHGTGSTIIWGVDVHQGEPRWEIRETYEVLETKRSVTRTVASVPAAETARAAKCFLLLAIERRLDSAIADMERRRRAG